MICREDTYGCSRGPACALVAISNGWLAEARTQERLGWQATLSLDPARRVAIAAAGPDGPLTGARILAIARHPVGRAPDVTLNFRETAPGRYRSLAQLPAGRWNLHLLVRRGDSEARLIETLP